MTGAVQTEAAAANPAPPVDPNANPAAPAAPAPAAIAEPAPQPEPAPAANKSPWYLQRLAEEAAARREAEARARAAEERAAAAEAARQQGTPGQTPAPAAQTQAERQAEINAAAEKQRFYEDTSEVLNKGVAQFGQPFIEAVTVLNSLGATNNDDFVADILAVDRAKAHEIIKNLAKDPEIAVALTRMTSRQRIAELTRMTIAANASPAGGAAPNPAPAPPPAAKTTPAAAAAAGNGLSRAPAPPPPVDSGSSQVVDWQRDGDKMSDAEWNRQFDEHQRARTADRR